ncbi:MAG: uracil-DNA glycosylase [Thermoprotei archaeon]
MLEKSAGDVGVWNTLDELNSTITGCTLCPRLVEYRARVARVKVRRFAHEEYWGKPLTGFGDRRARILVLGLAPAAHGGNRTGRMFTGDSSGDFLMGSLYRVGLASKPTSRAVDDGLKLRDVYVTASVRCVPPANKPTKEELDNCFRYLQSELRLLQNVRVIVCLGAIAFTTAIRLTDCKRVRFRHMATVYAGQVALVASYHPSQRNTRTGLLTQTMLDDVFRFALGYAGVRAS